MKTREDKIMIILEFFLLLKISLFGHILKITTFTFGAQSFLLVHIQFTLSEGPKGFFQEIVFSDHKSWTSKKSIFYGPTSWSMV